MHKDLIFPEIKNVYVVAVKEWNDDFGANIWVAYLVNHQEEEIDNIMVVTKASGTLQGEMRKTSLLRHAYPLLGAFSATKIELIPPDLEALDNEFMVTFFQGKTLYDKKYFITKAQFAESNLQRLPVLEKNGIIAR